MCVHGAEPALVHAGEQLLLPGLGPLASIARRVAEAAVELCAGARHLCAQLDDAVS